MQVAVGAVDGIAAKVLEQLPCEALWLSSFEIASSMGLPDDDRIGLDDLSRTVRAVCRVSTKPLILDASNGVRLGVSSVASVLGKLDRSATLVIDDTRFPRNNSFSHGGVHLVSEEEMRQRIVALIKASSPYPNLNFGIRTEGYTESGDLAGTLSRLQRLLNAIPLRPRFILIHGYDLVRDGAQVVVESLSSQSLLALSTLSPGSFMQDFACLPVDTLVIPNVLTMHRLIEGKNLVDGILAGSLPMDGNLGPFARLLRRYGFEEDG